MASQFPHTKFNGFDIGAVALSRHTHEHSIHANAYNPSVPIATRHPLPNVQFELHDVNMPVRWPDNTMDLVHARATDMAVSVPVIYSLF
jgi:hypothetical protein